MRIALTVLLLLACASAVAAEDAAAPEGSYTDKHLPTDDADTELEAERTFLPVTHPGRKVRLRVAAQALVPKGCWKMYIEPGIEDQRVSWGTGPRWPEVVRRMAHYADLESHFNYQDCRVGLARTRGAAKRLAGLGGAEMVAASTEGSTGEGAGGDTTPSSVSEQITYLEPDQRLSEALDKWVRERGWSGVAWEIDRDFRIAKRIPMKGAVIQAVTRLFETYRRQGAMTDVEPVFARGNRMVVVRPMDRAVNVRRHDAQ